MRTTVRIWALGIAAPALVLAFGCSESKAPAPKQQAATVPVAAPEKPALKPVDPASAGPLVGTWHNDKQGAIFPEAVLRGDGTGTFTNYAGRTSEGTWEVEDGYLEFKAGGEKAGSGYKVTENQIEMGYVGNYARVK